jgi:hypothetical protein
MISEQRLHAQASSVFFFFFPNNPGFFHSSLTQGSGSGNALTGFLRDRHRLTALDRSVPNFLRQTRLTASKMNQDIQQRSYRLHTQRFGSEWRREPILGSVQGFYLHAPGLTLVTLGTACVPSVRPSPTTWEITGPSKGLRLK